MRNKFGNWLYHELRRVGWTTSILSNKMGIKSSNVLRWLNKNSFPSLENLMSISEVLHVTIGVKGSDVYINGRKL
jgi:transcriptional regulator with XRE-family HTH domain